MSARTASGKVNFATFFRMWADDRRWEVPAIHWRAVHWLEHRADLAVLRCFRGFGKSTLLAVYNAWRYYQDPTYRILHQGDQDRTAYKTSRDTRAVLQRHPLTRDDASLQLRGEQSFWWVTGADDERNPSMQAAGITSNITSSRCDEAQNDDVEVPRNIQNPEAREKMRYRLGEQIHCMVPGARQLFIGTPHTHDSLYDEQERMGADCLTIPMFAQEFRIEAASKNRYSVPFKPDMVFSGIGEHSKVLQSGSDYRYADGVLELAAPTNGLIDCYAGIAWPERFTPGEMVKRRRKCKTVNEWDSQYQLHSRPLHETRLNPDRLAAYDLEPVFLTRNGEFVMRLGNVRIVAAAGRWDPSSGKLRSDVSAFAVVLQDEDGRRYLHRVEKLSGDVVEFGDDGKTVIGGQVKQICDLVDRFRLPRVSIETNGIGKFSPAVLKGALKQRRLKCGVSEVVSTQNKQKRILEALEPLLSVADQLWAHVSVIDGPACVQMREWNPAMAEQPDDYVDVIAGAVTETPERITNAVAPPDVDGFDRGISRTDPPDDWRPSAGVHEIPLEA